MKCPGMELLTNDNIINMFQACFRIGHYQTERNKDQSGKSGSAVLSLQQAQALLCSLGDLAPPDQACDQHLMRPPPRACYLCLPAELLTQASRQIMIEMVTIIFKRLADMPEVPMTPNTARSVAALAHSPRLQVETSLQVGGSAMARCRPPCMQNGLNLLVGSAGGCQLRLAGGSLIDGNPPVASMLRVAGMCAGHWRCCRGYPGQPLCCR